MNSDLSDQVDALSHFPEEDFICGCGGNKLLILSRCQNCSSDLRKNEDYESSDRTPVFFSWER